MLTQQEYDFLNAVRTLETPTAREVSKNTRFGWRCSQDHLKRLRREGLLYIDDYVESTGNAYIYGLTEQGYNALQAVEA